MTEILLYLVSFAIAHSFARFLTPFFIGLAYRTNLLDHPFGRKQHKNPTPFFGGVVIFISFWGTVFLAGVMAYLFGGKLIQISEIPYVLRDIVPWTPKILGVFLGSAIVLIVGIWDDRFDLSPTIKFISQAAAAFILLLIGLRVNLVQELGWFGYFVTFVWIILLMNAFNFIDSIDGHCTGVALISTVMFFSLTQIMGQAAVSLVVLTFSGALFGFFKFNVKPAQCFLGDNGSLFIGYMMSVITLLCRYNARPDSVLSPLIPILMFGVPIYDTLSVIAMRLIRGIPPWKGDRNHFAYRLVRLGMGERVAALFSYFTALTLGLLAVLSTQVTTFLGNTLIVMLFVSIISIVAFLEYYATLHIQLVEKLAAQHKRRQEDIREAEEEEWEKRKKPK